MKCSTDGFTITDVAGMEMITIRPLLVDIEMDQRFVEIRVRLDGGGELSFDRAGLKDHLEGLWAAQRAADTLAKEIGEDG